MFMLPVPVILLLLRSKSPPNCGDVSSTISFCPLTMLPPVVVPSPTYTFLVSVVYTNSPASGVIAVHSAFVPLLSLRAIFNSWNIYMYLYKYSNKLLSSFHKTSSATLNICFNSCCIQPKVYIIYTVLIISKQFFE